MDAQSLTTETETQFDPLAVPLDRLFRVPPEVYRGMIEHALFGPDEVALRDGLLVRPTDQGASEPLDPLYRITLDVYDRVGGLDLLGEDDRKVELLDGLLVRKMTKGDRHLIATHLIRDALAALVPRGWYVFKEDPVALPDGPGGHASMPEPDAAVIRGGIRDYRALRVSPADMALVVEVAETSLRGDRLKLARYAWAGVPTAWLVNLIDSAVEVHSAPSAAGIYQEMTIHHGAGEVPVVIDGLEVGRLAVADLLP